MQTIRQFPSWFSKQKLSGKLFIGCSGLFILFCLCIILSPSTPKPKVQNTSVAGVASTPLAAQTKAIEPAILTQAYETVLASLPTKIPILTTTSTPEPPTAIPSVTGTPDPYIYLFEVSSLVFLDHDANRSNGAGLKVYMGEQKTFIFEIIGGGDCPSMPSGQGYLVRYPDTGNEEWKDRRSMEESELFVSNDPFALYARDWKVYYNCP